MGKDNPLREPLAQALKAAGRYAVRCATMNGILDDFDPDALIQCLEIGFFGYFTEDGLSHIDDFIQARELDKVGISLLRS